MYRVLPETKDFIVNFTDYSFQKLCEREYGINRGVYNTIDRWFYVLLT